MTIDVNLLRRYKGGDPAVVQESELSRGRGPEVVQTVMDLDEKWRHKLYEMEQLRKDLNAINKQISERKKKDSKDKCEVLISTSTKLKKDLPAAEAVAMDFENKREKALKSIGNIVQKSVPISNDESDNKVERQWGVPRRICIDGTPGRMHHHKILELLGGVEYKKGVDVAGHRGYYLKGPGALLNIALVNYGLTFLMRKGYIPIQPPYFMKKRWMAAAAELEDFEETLYRIPVDRTHIASPPTCSSGNTRAGKDEKTESSESPRDTDRRTDDKDDLFLIATSEQPLCLLHRGESLDEKKLPYKYAGYSSCFRKEAGSHGKDCWGIFRVHQFEKIEQFVVCTPEDSMNMHEEMMSIAEEFYQSLELPYRVVSIVSGALNNAASKKYDLEAWFPGYSDYRELVSCSNCTDYQSRELDISIGNKGIKEKVYAHLLNATLVATQRCLCCILENYQTEEGVMIPRALAPYMCGETFLRFTQSPNKDKRES